MDRQNKLKKLILPILAVCFAAMLAVMIYALARPQAESKVEFAPPPFDSAAEQGVPDVSQELGYSSPYKEGMGYRFSVCGNVTLEGEKAVVYLTNAEDNNVWIKLRVFDESGEMLGETGLIKPNEYVKYVSLNKTLSAGTKVRLKIMGYEPQTYRSAGAAVLNTTIGGQSDQ